MIHSRTALRRSAIGAIALTLAATSAAAGAGHAERVATFDAEIGEVTEGVAAAPDGTVYVSVSGLGQLARVPAGGGDPEIIATLEGLQEGDIGLLGLAVNDGAIYGGVFSSNPELVGVWRFDAESGTAERVPGSESIAFPNDVTFSPDGTMYVSDTIAGAVYHSSEDGSLELWIQDPLLVGDLSFGLPFPIGANGLDANDETVYVGNTELATLVAIPIGDDGAPGEAAVAAQYEAGPDGVAIDGAGNVYATHPVANLVTKWSPNGEIVPVAVVDDGLDAPSSVELGVDADGNPTAYIANFSIAVGMPLGHGAGVVAVDVE